MATSEFQCNDEEFKDCDGDCSEEKAVENVKESKKNKCFWCSQLLDAKDTIENPAHTHFESCIYANINGFSMVFKELRKMNQKFETLSADIGEMKKRNADVMEEVVNMKSEAEERMEKHKTEIDKEILSLKSEIKKEMELKCGESRFGILSTVFKKFNALEEGMKEKVREMGSKKETEALRVQLRKSEEDIRAAKNEVALLKTTMETLSEQLKTNGGEFQALKKRMEEEKDSKNEFEMEILRLEPLPINEQITSGNGTFQWKIENYRRQLQAEKDNLVPYTVSKYFSAGPSFYEVRVRLVLNGVEGGKGPLAHIVFSKNQLDNHLGRAFRHYTTFKFVNLREPEKSISKAVAVEALHRDEYSFEIGEFEEVEKLVINDTLVCKVIIRPI